MSAVAAVMRKVWTEDHLLHQTPRYSLPTRAWYDEDCPGRLWMHTGQNRSVYDLSRDALPDEPSAVASLLDREIAHFAAMHWLGSELNIWPGWRF